MPVNPMKVRFDSENLEYLERQAQSTGRNITRVINNKLAECRNSIMLESFLEAVDFPKTIRLKSSSTTAEVHRICTLIRSGMLKNIVFGAKECAMNGHTLSGYMEFSDFVILLDNVSINHAREPRIMEVEDLLKVLAAQTYDFNIGLIQEVVDPTRELSLEEAWRYLQSLPVAPFTLQNFLKIIAPNQEHGNILPYMPDDGYCVKIEKRAEYGRNELIFLKSCGSKNKAEKLFESLLDVEDEDSKSEDEYLIILSVFGRPEKYNTLKSNAARNKLLLNS